MKIHHIGIISKNIDKDIKIYEKMGYSKISAIEDRIQNNKLVLLSMGQGPMIELIEPIDMSSSICNFQQGYHHICYEDVDNEFLNHFPCCKIGKIFTAPIAAPLLDNQKVIFAYVSNGTFIEFILGGK